MKKSELSKPTTSGYALQDSLGYTRWGEGIEADALQQMQNACRLPISVKAALMPDAHVGYGLPIGGVLGTRGAVIPYAVGVDIACRVMISLVDLPPKTIARDPSRLKRALEKETRFGIGANFRDRHDHEVMDENWASNPVTKKLKDKAWAQLGTSGSGNHFVEWGECELFEPVKGIEPGRYLALVSHSGSRGTGAAVAAHYSKLAQSLHPTLPRELRHLAWLPMNGEGQEYWQAMELMGKYASANHHLIHRGVLRAAGAKSLSYVENHHNFAWKERHDGEDLIVHRKGATPAGKGVQGYIPGTMTAPGFLVEGLGEPDSLDSASHGAGRRMSRTAAKSSITRHEMKKHLRERGVELLSAGLDEAPQAYKDIEAVMRAQESLVRVLGRFQPRIVKMAPEGEKAED
ncbi:MAG: RtcB family protein [Bdellovibrionales bacterium]|nr:RtcB family protein [Bdellovibrionales bacterium]